MNIQTFLISAVAALLSHGDRPASETPHSVADLQRGAREYYGNIVRVEGFIVFNGSSYLILDGRLRTEADESLGSTFPVSAWCTYPGQVTPLILGHLSSVERRKINHNIYNVNRGLVGQRVIIQGILRPSLRNSSLVGSFDHPYRFSFFGPLDRPRILEAKDVGCLGHSG